MTATATAKWANPGALKQARERLALPPAEVARQSRELGGDFLPVEERDLTAWESGTAEPDFEALSTLAEIYVCPVGWFFLDAIPREPERFDYRGLGPGGDVIGSTRQTLARFR